MTRVVVVTHEASRTGAPRMALRVLRALQDVAEERIVVVRWPGPLVPEFRSASDRLRLEPLRRLRVSLRSGRATRRLAVRVEEHAARRVLSDERPSLVYANTVKSACYIRPALELGVPVVLHCHEDDSMVEDVLARYRLDGVYDRVWLVACSAASASRLAEATGVDVGAVTVITEAVDVDDVLANAAVPSPGWARSTGMVVGGCGTVDYRKGIDQWLRVAAQVRDALGPTCPRFEWIGRVADESYPALARELGLGGIVEFVGERTNPYPMLAALDIVTVTSRHDAFPLVVLEAMALGRPIVAFDVGGIREQLGDTGRLVPGGDVDAMSAALLQLIADEPSRRFLASAAAERVNALFSIQQFRAAVAAVARAALAARSSGAADAGGATTG